MYVKVISAFLNCLKNSEFVITIVCKLSKHVFSICSSFTLKSKTKNITSPCEKSIPSVKLEDKDKLFALHIVCCMCHGCKKWTHGRQKLLGFGSPIQRKSKKSL